MKHFLFLFLFFTPFLQAQKPSYIFFEIKNNIKIGKNLSADERYKIKCFIEKNEKLSSVNQRDTVFLKSKLKNKPLMIELRQVINVDAQIIDNQLVGKFKNEAIGFEYAALTKIKQQKIIPLHSYKEPFSLKYKNGTKQVFTTVYDSIVYTQQVTLQIPTCINEKLNENNQGLVTVYYRASREHLNKNQPSASSGGKVMDWGHAFIGVKDLKNGKTYFLDGWPDSKFEEGNQHFEWNKKVDSLRTADHHSITFNTNRKKLNIAIKLIENYKTACINYEILDYNCTDATTEILEKMEYYTLKEHAGTVLPDSFANKLMDKLNKLGVCYEFDGKKIK